MPLNTQALLDQIHTINGTITVSGIDLETYRQWPVSITTANTPFLLPLIGSGSYESQRQHETLPTNTTIHRTVAILAVVGTFSGGKSSITALEATEKILDALITEYVMNNRWLCVSDVKLAGLRSPITISGDTGLTEVIAGYAGFRFNIRASYTVRAA